MRAKGEYVECGWYCIAGKHYNEAFYHDLRGSYVSGNGVLKDRAKALSHKLPLHLMPSVSISCSHSPSSFICMYSVLLFRLCGDGQRSLLFVCVKPHIGFGRNSGRHSHSFPELSLLMLLLLLLKLIRTKATHVSTSIFYNDNNNITDASSPPFFLVLSSYGLIRHSSQYKRIYIYITYTRSDVGNAYEVCCFNIFYFVVRPVSSSVPVFAAELYKPENATK